MSFKPGDKVCYSPDFFEGSKSELIEQYGTGEITTEEYADARDYPRQRQGPRLHLHLRLRLHLRPPLRFINIKWKGIEEEHWEYVDCLCLVEEREKRDIYKLFERVMNK